MTVFTHFPHRYGGTCSFFANAKEALRVTVIGMNETELRLVGRRELADLFALRDVEGVVGQEGFPSPIRLNTRVVRWRLSEVLAWVMTRQETRIAEPAGHFERRRKARRRPA